MLTETTNATDWAQLENALDTDGWALIAGVLTPEDCATLSGFYEREDMFRSRVVMARHGFGKGEYKYFSYPLVSIRTCTASTCFPCRSRSCCPNRTAISRAASSC
jgi:hypothetical protein